MCAWLLYTRAPERFGEFLFVSYHLLMSGPRFRAYRSGGGSPVVDTFNALDKAAQKSVVRQMRRELERLVRDPGQALGKPLQGTLRQSGQKRWRGAATRYIFDQRRVDPVLYDIFVKSEKSDNREAIARSSPRQRSVRTALADDPAALDMVTGFLAIDEQPDDPWKPFVARLSNSPDDCGVLAFETEQRQAEPSERDETGPTRRSGAERWQDQRARAEARRLAIAEEQVEAERAANTRAALVRSTAMERATVRRKATAEKAVALDEWRQPPFDLRLLEEWIALDETIERQADAIQHEAERNTENRETFRAMQEEELLALATGITELEANPQRFERQADEANSRRSMLRQIAGSMNLSGGGRLRIRAPEVAAESRSANEELERLRRREKKVREEVFQESRQETQRLKTLRRAREAVISKVGQQVVASNRPAIARVLPGGAKLPGRRNPSAEAGRDKKRFRVAALVARASFEHRLSLGGDAFAGMTREKRRDTAFFEDTVKPVCTGQSDLGIPPLTGFAADVEADCKPALAATKALR
jgi:hypothetical protein